ncbi:Imm30 family immunity protein [Acinetobacter calcoaceticus]|uniref:Imm30 family immunity protein n=1 Tax=Acinetobacter calcoaceticus TaxID=471 RepID=UPI001E2E92C1|nr:Imm30 family immunity protein [Acinetobacter calcoaceticus]UGQ27101.1 immunity 30 family protein [Acinetobacter calcoaceticus]
MTAHALEQAIKNLVKAAQIDNFGDVQAIDTALVEVMIFNDPSVIRPLIRLIDDSAQFDEAIFSIIHSIESFDDDVYISEALKELPYLVHKSPKWADILFMRILNSDSARECMIEKLYLASSEIKSAVLWAVTRINEKSSKFLEKTIAVMIVAKRGL